MRITSWGHAFFAATMISLGVMGLITGHLTPIWSPIPKGMPAHTLLAYLCAAVSLLAGAGLLVQRTAAAASRVLFGYLVAWLLLMDVPQVFTDSVLQFMWAAAELSVMLAAAWILFIRLNGGRAGSPLGAAGGERGLRIARALFGLTLIHFGIGHFMFLARTTSMVPGWLPWPMAWAYFFGVAFIAAGVSQIIGVYARLSAALIAAQFALFTVLVWIPVVTAAPKPSDWAEFIGTYAILAGSWVVAESYRATSPPPGTRGA
ncbi:MAG: DoxX family protein [Gemmatimonadetes bacterium]|nr:DoxX family protein [Gemmatimonadota bacterium]